jgi:hypothetical protein
MIIDLFSTSFSDIDITDLIGSIVSSLMLVVTVDEIIISVVAADAIDVIVKIINVVERVEMVCLSMTINAMMIKIRNVVSVIVKLNFNLHICVVSIIVDDSAVFVIKYSSIDIRYS